jgi:hypothetical protein
MQIGDGCYRNISNCNNRCFFKDIETLLFQSKKKMEGHLNKKEIALTRPSDCDNGMDE